MESLIEETEFSASYYSLLKRLLEIMNENKIADPWEQMSVLPKDQPWNVNVTCKLYIDLKTFQRLIFFFWKGYSRDTTKEPGYLNCEIL